MYCMYICTLSIKSHLLSLLTDFLPLEGDIPPIENECSCWNRNSYGLHDLLYLEVITIRLLSSEDETS